MSKVEYEIQRRIMGIKKAIRTAKEDYPESALLKTFINMLDVEKDKLRRVQQGRFIVTD